MVTNTIAVAVSGVITYWNSSATTISKLRDACVAVDPDVEKWLPAPTTPMQALRRGLETVFPTSTHLIRKLRGNGYEVLLETRGVDVNTYTPVATVMFDDADVVRVSGVDLLTEQNIHASYAGSRDICEPGTLGSAMSYIVSRHLGGTNLRPRTGGVYWLPDSKLALWNKLTAAIESASINGDTSVHILRHEMDSNAVRAIAAAISAELADAAAGLRDTIATGDLGKRALASKESQANDLLRKAREYEDMLGVSLDAARKALDDVKEAAATAAVLAAATDDNVTVAGAVI